MFSDIASQVEPIHTWHLDVSNQYMKGRFSEFFYCINTIWRNRRDIKITAASRNASG